MYPLSFENASAFSNVSNTSTQQPGTPHVYASVFGAPQSIRFRDSFCDKCTIDTGATGGGDERIRYAQLDIARPVHLGTSGAGVIQGATMFFNCEVVGVVTMLRERRYKTNQLNNVIQFLQ